MDFLMMDPATVHYAITPLVVGGAIAGAGALGNLISGLFGRKQKFKFQESREEKEYLTRLREMADRGALDVPGLTNEVSRTISQGGVETGQKVQGQLIGQGLEKSIVATEMKRRVGRDTLRSIAEQARKIRMKNEETKAAAVSELGVAGRDRSARMMALQRLQQAAKDGNCADILGGILSGSSDALSKMLAGYLAGGGEADLNEEL